MEQADLTVDMRCFGSDNEIKFKYRNKYYITLCHLMAYDFSR
ncbi:hypothetical protein IMSAGC013_02634 [Lachnospiraceae bacterium]|nr:hypothetical protein IMSAGC013_02634 [Lachnospiraceae bacterium]